MGAALLAAIPAIAQMLIGGAQAIRGGNIVKNINFPTYDIPPEISANQQLAAMMAMQGLPSAQYNQALNNIMRNQTFGLSALQDRRSALPGIGNIVQRSNDATLGLDVSDANLRRQNQLLSMQQNQLMAGYRDKAFDWNNKYPYLRDYNYGRSLQGAGWQNVFGGLNNLSMFGMMKMNGGMKSQFPQLEPIQTMNMYDPVNMYDPMNNPGFLALSGPIPRIR